MFGSRAVAQAPERVHADRPGNEVDAPLRQNDRPLILLIALGIALGFGVGTQYVAWRFAFHPNLGQPFAVPEAQTLRVFRALAVASVGSAFAIAILAKARAWTIPLLLCGSYLAALGAGPIYAPHRILIWAIVNSHNSLAASIFRVAWLIAGAESIASSALVLGAWRARTRSPPPRP